MKRPFSMCCAKMTPFVHVRLMATPVLFSPALSRAFAVLRPEGAAGWSPVTRRLFVHHYYRLR